MRSGEREMKGGNRERDARLEESAEAGHNKRRNEEQECDG